MSHVSYSPHDFFRYEVWLQIKQKEFAKNGYEQVTIEDLWNYCVKFLWKNHRPERYHEEVRSIMAIEPNDYFNFASLEAQVYNVSSLEDMQLDDLLGL